MDAALERRLKEMLDRQEIWQVMQRYARGLDRLDVELARTCYFDDCTEDHGNFVGDPDGFIEWANATARHFEWTHHSITTHNCDLQGDDAYCETYYIYMGVKSEPPHFMSTGRYIDHFQRRNGEWRIANRVVIVEGAYDIEDSAQNAITPPAYGPDEVYPATRDKNDISYHRPPQPRQPKI